jgi:hypothetical protein
VALLKVLATDVDDVLVNIAEKWVRRARAHPLLQSLATFTELPDGELELRDAVRERSAYPLLTWLRIPSLLRGVFDSVYYDSEDFYDDLVPTPFCRGVMAAIELGRGMGPVHVVTHIRTKEDAATASKRRWLERYLPSSDSGGVSIYSIPAGTKKSAVMRSQCPEVDSYAEDSMANVMDVLLEEHFHASQILMPRMGYNPLAKEIAALARLRCTSIDYYENIF